MGTGPFIVRLTVQALIGLAVLCAVREPLSAEEAFIVDIKGYVLRSAPGIAAGVAGRVKVGDKVFVTGRNSGWVQVEIGDQQGWLLESAIGGEPPASIQLGPVQERLAALEAGAQDLENQKQSLQHENIRLGSRITELETQLARAKKEIIDTRSSGRFKELALGGGLVIVGWLAGYALAALSRRRGGSSRYRIE